MDDKGRAQDHSHTNTSTEPSAQNELISFKNHISVKDFVFNFVGLDLSLNCLKKVISKSCH